MKRPGLKKESKRTSVRLREKVKKKVRDHNRKLRKENKTQKTKKQHVPANAPFKVLIFETFQFEKYKLCLG